jgi:pimeloyl-ACP methyl ester carboxylesterase
MMHHNLLFIKVLGTCLLLFGVLPAAGQTAAAPYDYSRARSIVTDRDSIVTPNGVQQTFQATVGGLSQWVYVRGQEKQNPIILFVHGGPASPMAPVAWMWQKPLEEYFTMVHYDQRGAGKTYATTDTTGLGKTITTAQYVADAIEMAQLVCRRYGKQKVILMGHSWGTIVGLQAARKRPDLFYAYVGIGQIINWRDNEQASFDFGLAQATKHKNEEAMRELRSIAPYPGSQPITRERIIIARKWPQYYGGLSAYRNTSTYFFRAPQLSPLYTPADVAAIDQGSLYTLGRLLPELLTVDFKPVKSFPIPVFMLMGRHDYTTPNEPTVKWLQALQAPLKKGVWFEHSSHLLPLEEPGKLLLTLVQEVRPLTVPPSAPKPRR